MSKKFDRTLALATDSTVLETNWDAVLECVDMIRGGEVPAKSAMAVVQKRMMHENPHVCIHTLTLLEAIVKNCGKKVHTEIATRDFMEDFKNLAIESKAEPVKNKVLELLQCWAMAFAAKSEYKIIVDTHNLMKLAGFEFPSIKETEAMFAAQVAPEWEEGDSCFRCRNDFGLLTRKHHCRACGQIFCNACSSKEMLLPQFGIEKPVRVCDACYEKGVGVAVGRPGSTVRIKEPQPTGPAVSSQSGGQQGEISTEEKQRILREKEEEELALAIALSQSEAEAKEVDRQKSLYSIYNGVKGDLGTLNLNDSTIAPSEVTIHAGYKGAAEIRDSPSDSGSMVVDDPLARYLNRDYWQQRKTNAEAKVEQWEVNPSAPLPSEPSINGSCATTMRGSPVLSQAVVQRDSVDNVTTAPLLDDNIRQKSEETTKFCDEIREQVESMENRIRSNTARGRPLFNDTAIQGLYMRLTELHAQVMQRMNEFDNQRTYFESLQDHLSHITEARAAINALREEEERKRAELAAEEQRMRQSQMQHKLAAMRQQKHDMLMYQRQMAIQKFQQQEAEMAARRQQLQQPPSQNYYGQYQPVNSIAQPASLYAPPPTSQVTTAYPYAQQYAGYPSYGQQPQSLPQTTQTTSTYTAVDQQQQQGTNSINGSPYPHQGGTPVLTVPQGQPTVQNGYPVATSSAFTQQHINYAQNGQLQQQQHTQPSQQSSSYQGQPQNLAHSQQPYAGYQQQQYSSATQQAPPQSVQQQYYQQPFQFQQLQQPTVANIPYTVPQNKEYVQATTAQNYVPTEQPAKEEMLISFD